LRAPGERSDAARTTRTTRTRATSIAGIQTTRAAGLRTAGLRAARTARERPNAAGTARLRTTGDTGLSLTPALSGTAQIGDDDDVVRVGQADGHAQQNGHGQ